MDLTDKKNSITYDSEKDELKIVTYYDQQQYEERWIKEPYLTNIAYLISIKTFDSKVKSPPILSRQRIMGKIIFCLSAFITVFFVFLYTTEIVPHSDLLLLFVLLVASWISLLLFPQIVLCNIKRAIRQKDILKPDPFHFTFDAIQKGFEQKSEFRQEVTIGRNGHTLTTPYPNTPTIHSTRGEIYIRVMLKKNDLYFLQLESNKQGLKYVYSEGLHFVKNNYLTEDWNLLLSILKKMEYL